MSVLHVRLPSLLCGAAALVQLAAIPMNAAATPATASGAFELAQMSRPRPSGAARPSAGARPSQLPVNGSRPGGRPTQLPANGGRPGGPSQLPSHRPPAHRPPSSTRPPHYPPPGYRPPGYHHHRYYYYGGHRYYTGLFAGIAIGAYLTTLPATCVGHYVHGVAYYACGETWLQYAPGSTTTYVVVASPY